MSASSYNSYSFTNKEQQNHNLSNSTNYNTNTNHPLIPNSQEYIFYKKYVSIHSEDRDMLKFPSSSEYEIEMPEDLLNVASLRLVSWTFPSNYNTFSILNSNVSMTFSINKPYDPNINNVYDLLVVKTFECLYYSRNDTFIIVIEEGFYNPQQMVIELTNKFNNAVTIKLEQYFLTQSSNPNLDPDPIINTELQNEYKEAINLLNLAGGYTNFIIVYNNVSQKIWFGNTCDEFTITNETLVIKNTISDNLFCGSKNHLHDFSNWGLPSNLGFTRCNNLSVNGSKLNEITVFTSYNGITVPRFYYGDVFPGDNGYWLLPNPILIGSEVNWVECSYKINLMGPSFMYMEIEGQNCIDETSPFNVSPFTLSTNMTNGIVNSAFAKIAIPTTPISQWFDRDSLPYKFYYPPAEKMRRLKFKIRYHNGETVNFGIFNYSFVIEFTIQLPQSIRTSKSIIYEPHMYH